MVYLYQAALFEGELLSSDEGEVWWEELDNLPNLQLSLDMEDMIKVILDDELSEFFYRKEGEEWVYNLN